MPTYIDEGKTEAYDSEDISPSKASRLQRSLEITVNDGTAPDSEPLPSDALDLLYHATIFLDRIKPNNVLNVTRSSLSPLLPLPIPHDVSAWLPESLLLLAFVMPSSLVHELILVTTHLPWTILLWTFLLLAHMLMPLPLQEHLNPLLLHRLLDRPIEISYF